MNLIPFKKVTLSTILCPEEVKLILSRNVVAPSLNLDADKIINHRVLEGLIDGNHFEIVMGRYGLTLGSTSLLPLMKGEIYQDKNQGSKVYAAIRPSKRGLLIIFVAYVVAIVGIYSSIIKGLPEVLVTCLIMIVVTYGSIMQKFNRETANYLKFFQTKIGAEVIA